MQEDHGIALPFIDIGHLQSQNRYPLFVVGKCCADHGVLCSFPKAHRWEGGYDPEVYRQPLDGHYRSLKPGLCGLVTQEHNPLLKGLCLDQFESQFGCDVLEERRTFPHHHRMNQKPILINEITLHQHTCKLTAAAEQYGLALLLL